MNISSNPSVGYIALLLFLIGLFLFVSGLNIIKIEKITVSSGFKTWVIGLILMIAGVIVGVKEEILNEPLINQEKTENTNNDKDHNSYGENLTDWYIWGGNSYQVSEDKKIFHSVPKSLSIKSINNISPLTDGGLSLQLKPYNKYLGKKVKITGHLKTKDIDNAFIWLNFFKNDSIDREASTNLKSNSDWYFFEMIVKIPSDAETITFGLSMGILSKGKGTGQAWIDDVKFELASDDAEEKADRFH